MISFTIPVEPRSVQKGARAYITSKGKIGFYNDKAKETYYREIRLLAAFYAPQEPISGPIKLLVRFVLKRPKSHDLPKKSPKHGPGQINHYNKPDLANLIKGLEDALSSLGFWIDDKQIAAYGVRKAYAAKGEEPYIMVVIEPMGYE